LSERQKPIYGVRQSVLEDSTFPAVEAAGDAASSCTIALQSPLAHCDDELGSSSHISMVQDTANHHACSERQMRPRGSKLTIRKNITNEHSCNIKKAVVLRSTEHAASPSMIIVIKSQFSGDQIGRGNSFACNHNILSTPRTASNQLNLDLSVLKDASRYGQEGTACVSTPDRGLGAKRRAEPKRSQMLGVVLGEGLFMGRKPEERRTGGIYSRIWQQQLLLQGWHL
ncbi:hypothetical protein FA15DRAFT_660904, partial [Coprinopsis marcescibilis]